jgi:uncharacterized membrane protein
MTFDKRLNSAWWMLKVGLGLGPFLAGLDKFFNILVDWQKYLNPTISSMLPVTPATFMHMVGIVEMIVGLAILTRWTRLASYAAMAWLLAIAVNLASTGMFFDLAVRDVEMATGAYALARLTEVRETSARSAERQPVNEARNLRTVDAA